MPNKKMIKPNHIQAKSLFHICLVEIFVKKE